MSLEISLFAIMFFYIAICSFLCTTKPRGTLFAFYLAVYFLFCALLVLPSVKFLGAKVVIGFCSSAPKVSFDFSLRNITLNFALAFPLGGVLRCKRRCHARSLLFGALFGAVIEFLQLVLPLGRVVDPADILFCAIGTLVSYVFCKNISRRKQQVLWL